MARAPPQTFVLGPIGIPSFDKACVSVEIGKTAVREVAERFSNIRQFPKGQLNRKASLPNKCSASQLGLISLIGARYTHADLPCTEEQVTGWGRHVLFENKLAFEHTVF